MLNPAQSTQEEYRKNEKIWQRVSPSLAPYPAVHAEAASPEAARPSGGGEREAELLRDFLRGELADAHTYCALASVAPAANGKRLLRCFASEETEHARRLRAAYFLLTGETYCAAVVLPPLPKLPWRDHLRQRYREESSNAARYALLAGETADVCLSRLLQSLSADEYRHAELLQAYLARIL